ncbi:MAG: cytochrome B [Gammaproteobacteria bacterium HGW-Gammaproteobacteria-9]|nr:MAG: cytochrome B [Gammaproteobacteria bacterium HGW-Gammaproteobacteria-9]
MRERLYLFTRFERFWHWSQAALIITLLVSGFAAHGSHALLDFRSAVEIHEVSAWLLMLLWVFGIFWHFTTGQWRQYTPTLSNIDRMLRYYVHGIFIGAPHPYKITVERKHNPLQRLSYLFVKVMIGPLLWLTGLLYLFFDLQQVALLHTAGAFMMLIFLIVHVYLATTGRTPLEHVRAMLTGWEEKH